MRANERDPTWDRQTADYERRKKLPNFDCLNNYRAGRLMKRLYGWLEEPENKKAFDFIDALRNRFNELQDKIETNTNDGHLIKGLIGEQQQILKELEAFILKCLQQRNKEKKKKQ